MWLAVFVQSDRFESDRVVSGLRRPQGVANSSLLSTFKRVVGEPGRNCSLNLCTHHSYPYTSFFVRDRTSNNRGYTCVLIYSRYAFHTAIEPGASATKATKECEPADAIGRRNPAFLAELTV